MNTTVSKMNLILPDSGNHRFLRQHRIPLN
jgi:hypothetical protein